MAVTCRNILELHHSFIDGELSPSLMAEVHAHLLQCPECQQQVEMLRAVGDVIAKDNSAPRLSADFASRVIAAMPQTMVVSSSEPRRFTWRMWTATGLSAAAMLFFSIAFWPKEDTGVTTKVAGISVAKSMVDPTVNAVTDAQKTASNLKGLLEISADQTRQDVQQGINKAGLRSKAGEQLSITRILFQPFDEILNSPEEPAEKPESKETVRF